MVKRICGSFSKGSRYRYPYYHCRGRCRARTNAVLLNYSYESQLRQLNLSSKAVQLFNYILDDANLNTNRAACLNERAGILRQLARRQLALSKARKLFVEDMLKFDDYSEFKSEYVACCARLKKELGDNIEKLNGIDLQRRLDHGSLLEIFSGYELLDTADKKYLLKFIPPAKVNFVTGELSLELSSALSKILVLK